MTKIANQTGIILDAISSGPIEGLVNGGESVFLNNAPSVSGDPVIKVNGTNFNLAPREFNVSTLPSTPTINVPLEDLFTSYELTQLRAGDHGLEAYIWIEGAGRTVSGGAMGGIYARKTSIPGQEFIFDTLTGRVENLISSDIFVNDGKYDQFNSAGAAYPGSTEGFFHRECVDISNYDFNLANTGADHNLQTAESFVKQTFTAHYSTRNDIPDKSIRLYLTNLHNSPNIGSNIMGTGGKKSASSFMNATAGGDYMELLRTTSANTNKKYAQTLSLPSFQSSYQSKLNSDAAGLVKYYVFDFIAPILTFNADNSIVVLLALNLDPLQKLQITLKVTYFLDL